MVKKNAFNTVTTFSKITALVMFIMFPVVTFYLGVMYQERLDKPFMQQYVKAIKPIQNHQVLIESCEMVHSVR